MGEALGTCSVAFKGRGGKERSSEEEAGGRDGCQLVQKGGRLTRSRGGEPRAGQEV